MPPTGMIIIFIWVLFTCFIFLICMGLSIIAATKFTKFIKRNSREVWTDAKSKVEWVGIPIPAFLVPISPTMVPEHFEKAYAEDITYLKLKKLVQVTRKAYIYSFGLGLISLFGGVTVLITIY